MLSLALRSVSWAWRKHSFPLSLEEPMMLVLLGLLCQESWDVRASAVHKGREKDRMQISLEPRLGMEAGFGSGSHPLAN